MWLKSITTTLVTAAIIGMSASYMGVITRVAVLEAKVGILQEVLREVALWKK